MSTKAKGKMPISQKYESDSILEEFSTDPTRLSPELKKELDEQGLVGRWLNVKTYQAEGNYHKSGWRAYRRPEEVRNKARGTFDYMDGMDPEGYVRSRDLILGVKTKEAAAKAKRLIQYKNEILKGSNKAQAQRLRDEARSRGVDMTVADGYDESGGFKGED